MAEPSEARELDLVGKVEFRIALADSDAKLATLLKTYLPALLLKLTSRSQAVRNKVISVCQHITNRVKSPSIQLPVFALLKQFRDVDNALVRHFDLLYIQQGVERLSDTEKGELLLEVLKALPILESDENSTATPRATIFNLFLRLLPLWKLPARGTKEDISLRDSIEVSAGTMVQVSRWLTKLVLLEPNGQSPGLSRSDEDFLQLNKSPGYWAPGTGTNLFKTKVAAAHFLASGAFEDSERFLAAVALSSDNNAPLSNVGDIIFKQHTFDLENETNVGELFELYFGQQEAPIRLPARPKLQTRILTLLCKSKTATRRTDRILQLLGDELFTPDLSKGGGLEASKLRGQIFAVINWTTRMGDENSLKAIAPHTVRSLRDYIVHQGWPTPDATGVRLGPAEVDLRSHAYESIGILCPHADTFQDLDLVKWLFTSLRCDVSDSQIFVSIETALGRALNVVAGKIDNGQMQDLQLLLQWQMNSELGETDPEYGFETKRSTKFVAVRFANRCLPFHDVDARWIDLMAISGAQTRQELVEEGRKGLDPQLFTLLNSSRENSFTLPNFTELANCLFTGDHRTNLLEPNGRHFRALATAVSFARNVLVATALTAEISVQDEPGWDRKLDTLLINDENARGKVRKHLRTEDPEAITLLLESACLGLCHNQGNCGEYLVELLGLVSDDLLRGLFDSAEPLSRVATSNNRPNQFLAARAIGILCSSAHFPEEKRVQIFNALDNGSSLWKTAVGQEVNQVRGALLSKAFILTRLILRGKGADFTSKVTETLNELFEVLQSRDLGLRDAAEVGLGQMMLCGGDTAHHFALEKFDKTVDEMVKDGRKEHEPAVTALGRLGFQLSAQDKEFWETVIRKLRDMHDIRRPELHFAIGEALSVAATGWHSKSLLAERDVETDDPRNVQSLNNDQISSLVEKTIEDCKNTKPSLRKAAAIWLLCLVQYCGTLEVVRQHLRKCQAAFARLLSDRDDVVQEAGSRGLGLVYEMGDEDIKQDLVKDLVQSFTGNNAKLGGQVEEDTVLFEEGALPTGDGASVKTYGEVVKLAQEVGQPSLVYSFMNLAANNAIWTSRAAFGRFGLSNVLADSTLLAENPSFYPKLYRYRFDPNPNVQRSMNDIWTALVKDTNAVLDKHFDAIITDLLKSIVGREWRVREASCAAIADLIQGRDVEKYEKYLNEIWTLAFRVGLDDIKETVRVAGMALIRTLVNLLVRNLEVGDGGSKRAQMMLSHAMPFLLRQLQSGSTKEIQEYAVATMIRIVRKSPSRSIEPFAPQLIEHLMTSLSSLEPEMINYIHLNAAKYGLTSEKIDQARISDMGVSPIMQAVERCLEGLEEKNMSPSMSALENAMKSAIGLPSKVGCSRVIVTLCVRHTLNFRPYADRFVQLVRKQVLDRNETVSISYSMSLAYLTRLASEKQVEDLIGFARKLYFESEETSHRAVSGELIHSISKLANDKFMAYATGFLPLAYVAKNDSEEQIRDLFDKTWKDNVGGSRAVVLYLQEIQELTARYIESPKWAVKHAAAKAISDLVTSIEGDFNATQADAVWSVLEKALAGKTWDGKEGIVKALPSFATKSRSIWQARGGQMQSIAIREAKRTNIKYRPSAIKSLGEFARERDDLDLLSEILSIAQNVIEGLADEPDDKMDVDGETTLTLALRDETAATIVNSVLINLSAYRGPEPSLKEEFPAVLKKCLTIGGKATKIALYESAKIFFDDFVSLSSKPNEDQKMIEVLKNLEDLAYQVLHIAVIGPIGEEPAEAEPTRLKRAEALLACSLAATMKSRVGEVTPRVAAWTQEERSVQVRRLLESATRNLSA